jgi:arsenate reductase-like glutaredoxin family protein
MTTAELQQLFEQLERRSETMFQDLENQLRELRADANKLTDLLKDRQILKQDDLKG